VISARGELRSMSRATMCCFASFSVFKSRIAVINEACRSTFHFDALKFATDPKTAASSTATDSIGIAAAAHHGIPDSRTSVRTISVVTHTDNA
jgi:hypothetical protein